MGTPDYMAPEVIQGRGYDLLVDYWSVGCMAYEMFACATPFCQPSLEETFRDILAHDRTLERPFHASQAIPDGAWSLIRHLLTDRTARMGSIAEARAHPWLALLPWEALRTTDAPLIPHIAHAADTSNFDEIMSAGPNELAGEEGGVDVPARVIGFTYKRFDDTLTA